MDDIIHILMPIISNLLSVALSLAVGYFWNKAKDLQHNREKVENGVRALLKDRIMAIHSECVKVGCISYAQMASAESMYTAYHGLGGNGMGTAMIEDLRELEMVGVTDEICKNANVRK